MHFSFADGSVWDIPDMCGSCQMTTGGAHQPNCPLYQPLLEKESYSEFIERTKRVVDEHPEWGIRFL